MRNRRRSSTAIAPSSRSFSTVGRFAVSSIACCCGVSGSMDRTRTNDGPGDCRRASSAPKSVSSEMITRSPDTAASRISLSDACCNPRSRTCTHRGRPHAATRWERFASTSSLTGLERLVAHARGLRPRQTRAQRRRLRPRGLGSPRGLLRRSPCCELADDRAHRNPQIANARQPPMRWGSMVIRSKLMPALLSCHIVAPQSLRLSVPGAARTGAAGVASCRPEDVDAIAPVAGILQRLLMLSPQHRRFVSGDVAHQIAESSHSRRHRSSSLPADQQVVDGRIGPDGLVVRQRANLRGAITSRSNHVCVRGPPPPSRPPSAAGPDQRRPGTPIPRPA